MIRGLSVFAKVNADVPRQVGVALRCPTIKRITCCALGPKGNNIEQAATLWINRMGIRHKSAVVLRDTPEMCLDLARTCNGEGQVAVFWTCAVYSRENEFFFGNPDVFPFFFSQEMALDEMQLACKPANEQQVLVNDGFPGTWRIASHPSPAPLVRGLGEIALQNSNAAAAKACAEGQTELCITTESAREIYGLVKVHSFGSPLMVFFGGITQHGLTQIRAALHSMRRPREMA
jgi:hypothetical protein